MLSKLESKVRPMEYPLLTAASTSDAELESPGNLALRMRELESKLAEREQQHARKLESVRHEAVEQGKQQAGGDQVAWRQQCAGQLRSAVEQFRAQTDEYLARVEQEVVRLALAVAERILHRESQLDPLLLSGAVRVALGQLADSTEVRLRVPAGQQDMWVEMVRLIPGLALRPEVRADTGLQNYELVLESNLGVVDLGVRAQLEEIERGFFDLLEVRREPKGCAARPVGAGKQV
jgi:flagellar assembly protein FliH